MTDLAWISQIFAVASAEEVSRYLLHGDHEAANMPPEWAWSVVSCSTLSPVLPSYKKIYKIAKQGMT